MFDVLVPSVAVGVRARPTRATEIREALDACNGSVRGIFTSLYTDARRESHGRTKVARGPKMRRSRISKVRACRVGHDWIKK